ncbi:hypothetical protein NT6N_23970 [Oceaniferula spumae]|uniref:Uncharacterized protein n=1 Tax=Oceaniferula spumae TaxID=2979115 RepID=A0AAT9FML0_9BACT
MLLCDTQQRGTNDARTRFGDVQHYAVCECLKPSLIRPSATRKKTNHERLRDRLSNVELNRAV